MGVPDLLSLLLAIDHHLALSHSHSFSACHDLSYVNWRGRVPLCSYLLIGWTKKESPSECLLHDDGSEER